MADTDNGDEIKKLFAKNLKRLRENKKMSQQILAERADISTNYINDLEHANKWPSAKTLAGLEKALSVESYQFLLSDEKRELNRTELFFDDLYGSFLAMLNQKFESISKYKDEPDRSEIDPEKS